jgi:glycerol kinase
VFNIHTRDWDDLLLGELRIPRAILPEVRETSGVFGAAEADWLGAEIPIAGMAGDQQAALFGQACFSPGEAKCTFGTGSFIVMNTGSKPLHSRSGLLTTVAWQMGEEGKPVYALEGGAFVCGAAVQWLRDGLQIIKRSPEVEKLALAVADHGGVEFVPALTGLGAPHWAPEARGTITGLTRGTERGHIARATLDAMALQNADILRAMESDLGKRMKPLRVDGGAAANDLLMQIQADVLGRKLIRPQVIETTVAGACYLAGLGIGLWQNPGEIRSIWQSEREFRVKMSTSARRKRLESWNNALQRTLGA